MGVKKPRVNKYETVCRNGHTRTETNTYYHSSRRQCMDCPGFRRRQLSTNQRRLLDAGQLHMVPGPEGRPPVSTYIKTLSAEQLAYLRRLIPCVVCGMTQNAQGRTSHRSGCRVPYNQEDDGTAVPEQKTRAA